MAVHALSAHFDRFFRRLNPSASFEQTASSEHRSITALIENRQGPAGALQPTCFLQGSYRQDTAIYTINDVDIVALCRLWYPPSSGSGPSYWTRDRIFDTVAAAIAASPRYAGKVRYGPTSMVIHVDLAIKVEVLPVVFRAGNSNPQAEPFVLYRPERRQWEEGYAREHQRLLTLRNSVLTGSNFKPMIKVLKHLRSHWGAGAVSFHLECLLYALPAVTFLGGPADYIANVLTAIAATSADDWYRSVLMTPCGDRDIFTSAEWTRDSWFAFHDWVGKWLPAAAFARDTPNRAKAIEAWQLLLGDRFFPATVSP
jgi:Second Messenger Oligonucleotide or Dinucleotide Synthetase domain